MWAFNSTLLNDYWHPKHYIRIDGQSFYSWASLNLIFISPEHHLQVNYIFK
jgi:hypothetical protein